MSLIARKPFFRVPDQVSNKPVKEAFWRHDISSCSAADLLLCFSQCKNHVQSLFQSSHMFLMFQLSNHVHVFPIFSGMPILRTLTTSPQSVYIHPMPTEVLLEHI